MMKRIAHITIFFQNQIGVINKLENNAKVSIDNNIGIDFIWITTQKKIIPKRKYLKIIEVNKFGGIFAIRIKQVAILNRLSKIYSKIIMRYPLFDPIILLFLKNKKKYIFEHHTKEIEELNVKNDKRYYFEKFFGSKWLNLFGGIIGVTPEIQNYEVERSSFKGFNIFSPNSTPIKCKNIEGEIFCNEVVNFVMVANFRPWHGLNSILNEIQNDKEYINKYRFNIIGKVNTKTEKLLNKMQNVVYYGEKDKNEIEIIYKEMDIGLGSFNIQINKIKETTSLKVREYLANGLPVMMKNSDPAFPTDFKYIKHSPDFTLKTIFDFLYQIKGTKKQEILNKSKYYIDSKKILKSLYEKITENIG